MNNAGSRHDHAAYKAILPFTGVYNATPLRQFAAPPANHLSAF